MASYNHYQPIAASTWTINHGLGTNIIAFDAMKYAGNGVYEKIMPTKVEIVDDNTITVNFSTNIPGRARIVAN